MEPSGDAGDQNIMRFRVDSIIRADDVPYLTTGSPELRGQYILRLTGVGDPGVNHHYRPEQILPHLDAINRAIASQRVYMIETDNTASTWPHAPDPRGH